MKSIAFLFTLLIPVILHTQNINKLFKSLPLAAASCEDAFKSAELEWETETSVSYTHLTLPTNREV